MDNTQDAISYLRHYKTPFWRIMNGSAKVGEYAANDNLEQSIADFQTALTFLPAGTYKLKAADKPDKYNGAFETTFTKGQNSPAMQQNSFQAPSTNAYGIPDHVKREIETQARKDFMLEQLTNEVRELKETVRKIEQYLKEDADGDGTPDIFQTAKNAADTVQKVGEIKKVFTGSSVFGD
ncbi:MULTISPECIES: hypothetical protein [unclassified Spirosoma]|uniref:hypothetical protein n=1 Tax=unclassified Spirosoma TaxID=2621999 RepID=UPI00095F9017|nr:MULTISPECIES: hypothetical protein [unclassified Spirosoma]MBN8823885.1 hypothetical protein [Spirosoma sp.]OJW79723.1 MAG: hypothetical protein BGO59_00270 [Spirosoma sp. 48-14]